MHRYKDKKSFPLPLNVLYLGYRMLSGTTRFLCGLPKANSRGQSGFKLQVPRMRRLRVAASGCTVLGSGKSWMGEGLYADVFACELLDRVKHFWPTMLRPICDRRVQYRDR